jgi:starch synthase
MKIACIATEAVPLAKTGGLGDVVGALLPALERFGHEVALFLPLYRQAREAGLAITPAGLNLRIPLGSSLVEGTVQTTKLPGSNVRVYLIDQPHYFDRPGLYQADGKDYPDNLERFAFFDRAVLEAIRRLDFRPDILHVHDWQTGLIPVYVDELYRDEPGFASVGTLFTVHNLAYQGVFRPENLALAGLDRRPDAAQRLEFHGQLNLLKSALVYADMLSTVSPRYAREIQTPEYGHGLDGLLRARSGDLRGILNGIDMHAWSPAHEPMLAARYDAATAGRGKPLCKAWLQRRVGLAERPDIPLFAQIGRLDPQKGWDLLADVADDLLRGDVQLIVLGEGQPRYHRLLARLEDRYPGKVRAFLEFSNDLAHQIEAGADLFLMPSLYEPCGLNQLYSLVHGTVPIVRATGGLADTVVDATPRNLAEGTATGFVFDDPTPEALGAAIGRALALWPDRAAWHRLMAAGMRTDWSWDQAAGTYDALYHEVRHRALADRRRRQTAIAV